MLQLNIDSLEIEGLSGINETALNTAINHKLQQLIVQNNCQSQLMQSPQLQLNEMDLEIDTSDSVEHIAEQIAAGIVQQLGNGRYL